MPKMVELKPSLKYSRGRKTDIKALLFSNALILKSLLRISRISMSKFRNSKRTKT